MTRDLSNLTDAPAEKLGPGRPPGYVCLPDEPGRFKVTALASLIDWAVKKHTAGEVVVGWFSGRDLLAETDASGAIIDIAIAYPVDRKDGNSALRGPAGRLVRHLEEIHERGTELEQAWLNKSRANFTALLWGFALTEPDLIDRALRNLAAIDPQWPEIIGVLRNQLENFAIVELRRIEHDGLSSVGTNLFVSLLIGIKKLKERK